MDIRALTQHILDTHHAYLREHLPRIDRGLEEMGAPEPLLRVYQELYNVMLSHMMKEEQILFPGIFSMLDGGHGPHCGFEGPINQMRYEHDRIRDLEAKLRELAPQAGPFEADLIALLDDLAVHAGKEDDQLFPAVLGAVAVDA